MNTDPPTHPPEDGDFKHPDPIKDAALDWFVRMQAMPDDGPLKRQFQVWLAEDRRHAEAYQEYEAFWRMPELESVTQRLAARQDRAFVRRRRQTVWIGVRSSRSALFALGMALIVVAVGFQQIPALILHWQADYTSSVGGRSNVTLPDGSRMTLNTSSAVAIDFREGRRNVHLLEGEAFFDVVQNSARSFRVAGSFGEVEVKGTAFSVRSTGGEDRVILENGSLLIRRLSDKSDQAMLTPGDAITVSSNKVSAIEKTDPANALAWLEGRIIFRERPFSEIVDELKRYRRGSIISINRTHADVLVSGNYELSDPEGVLRSLAAAVGASVTSLPGGVLLLR